LRKINIALNCWQGDDVTGFLNETGISGGLVCTGSYPGRARSGEELRADLHKALTLIPGRHRVSLHAIYAEPRRPGKQRNELETRDFSAWIAWAQANRLGLDFNGTFFGHPLAASGFTLSARNENSRRFWIEHAAACRRIGADIGRKLRSPCVTNIWIPDGFKDIPFDRKKPREILKKSLDEIFARKFNPHHLVDSLEGKLFGIGSEAYVAGSYDFYLSYAVANGKMLCLDMGHFHPTESVADKLSALLLYLDGILLHISRGIRWDSDHAPILSDELRGLAEEIVRGGFLGRVKIGLDFFDASINRVAAWVIAARGVLKAFLTAMLEPATNLRQMERRGNHTGRLALLEELKTMPAGIVWNEYCRRQGVPAGIEWLNEIKKYERGVLTRRAKQ
jgi:L-rhamnose isomerase